MPDSSARAAWDIVNLALMTYTIFEIPYSMLFSEQDAACAWDGLMLVNLVVDILFLSDIAVTFHTAFYDNEGMLIEDHLKIAAHYFRSWFLLDVATSMPLDTLICTFDQVCQRSSTLPIKEPCINHKRAHFRPGMPKKLYITHKRALHQP